MVAVEVLDLMELNLKDFLRLVEVQSLLEVMAVMAVAAVVAELS